MIKNNKMTIPLIAALAIVLNSCGLSSMISKFNTIDYTVTPTEVAVHGGKVSNCAQVVIPEKYFNKSATMSFHPKLSLGKWRNIIQIRNLTR